MMIVQSSPALVLPDHREAGSKAGKFWVYEQAIRIPFYAIYKVEKASVAVYPLVEAHYQRCSPTGTFCDRVFGGGVGDLAWVVYESAAALVTVVGFGWKSVVDG